MCNFCPLKKRVEQCCYWGAEETDRSDCAGSESFEGTTSLTNRYWTKYIYNSNKEIEKYIYKK